MSPPQQDTNRTVLDSEQCTQKVIKRRGEIFCCIFPLNHPHQNSVTCGATAFSSCRSLSRALSLSLWCVSLNVTSLPNLTLQDDVVPPLLLLLLLMLVPHLPHPLFNPRWSTVALLFFHVCVSHNPPVPHPPSSYSNPPWSKVALLYF